jgi:hypothetical protein
LPDGLSADDFTVVDVMGNGSRPKVEEGKLVLLLAREPVYLVCESAAGLRACYEASGVGF